MYGCENGTITKAELQRIYAFELWCWRRLLRVPWIARRSNQSEYLEIKCPFLNDGYKFMLLNYGVGEDS